MSRWRIPQLVRLTYSLRCLQGNEQANLLSRGLVDAESMVGDPFRSIETIDVLHHYCWASMQGSVHVQEIENRHDLGMTKQFPPVFASSCRICAAPGVSRNCRSPTNFR